MCYKKANKLFFFRICSTYEQEKHYKSPRKFLNRKSGNCHFSLLHDSPSILILKHDKPLQLLQRELHSIPNRRQEQIVFFLKPVLHPQEINFNNFSGATALSDITGHKIPSFNF